MSGGKGRGRVDGVVGRGNRWTVGNGATGRGRSGMREGNEVEWDVAREIGYGGRSNWSVVVCVSC